MGKQPHLIRILLIYELLKESSDEQNPMSSKTILEQLANRGAPCDRRTLYNDVKILKEYGFEVMCVKGANQTNCYYFADRVFSTPELRILSDAVQAASFITERKTERLVKKILSLAEKIVRAQ
ncbi:MAG: HTH domain-containing protein [Clostridia bacterium]|nr:HTH domain-containing protein [Clostridia bacterium]